MGRRRLAPCCKVEGLNKGPWTPEEDMKLIAYIQEHGHENWRALPKLAGLLRCGKSCRLRWLNYLRPDVKRGNFTKDEEETIIKLHALLGNKWSKIASSLPGRTDNEIKNLWHTHLKKRVEPNSTSSSSSSQKEAKEQTQSSPSPCSYTICANCGTVNAKKVANHHSSKPSEESVTFDKAGDHDELTMELIDKCTATGAHPPAGAGCGDYRPECSSTISSLGSCIVYPDQFHEEINWAQGGHANDQSTIDDNNSKRNLIEIPDINIDQEVLWGFMDDDYYSFIPEMAPLVDNNVGVPYNKSIFGEESINEEFERSRWVSSRAFLGIN